MREASSWRTCVALPPRDALDSLRHDLEASGAEVFALEATEWPVTTPIPGARRLQRYWNQLALTRQIAQFYMQARPDVIHINLCSLITGRPLLLAAAWQGIPTVAVVHAAHRRVAIRRWDRILQMLIDRRGNTHWVTVAEDSKRHVVDTWGMPAVNVTVIPNGVDLARFALPVELVAQARREVRDEFALPAETILITTVAAINGQKGHDVLAQSVKPVIDQYPEVHFLWVGDGEQRATCERLVVELGVERHISFAGRRSDVPILLAASDIFVLPTFRESMPFALIEAMAAGLPCVASSVNGIPEVLRDEVEGLLVPPKSASALTAAIARLLADRSLAARYGKAARQRSAAFSAAEMCRKTTECYHAALLMHQRKL